jgi:hypothetical protein
MSKATKVPSHITFVVSRVPAWVYGNDSPIVYSLLEWRMYHWGSIPPILTDHQEVSGPDLLGLIYGSWKSLEDGASNRFLFRSFAGRSQELDQRAHILDSQGGPQLLQPGVLSLIDVKAGTRVHVAIGSECRGIITHVRKFVNNGIIHSLDVVK